MVTTGLQDAAEALRASVVASDAANARVEALRKELTDARQAAESASEVVDAAERKLYRIASDKPVAE
jgi:hypothetical protein